MKKKKLREANSVGDSFASVGQIGQLDAWEQLIKNYIVESMVQDGAHDIAHLIRVLTLARRLAQGIRAAIEVVMPAALMHDLVNVPKNSPKRSQASALSAKQALEWLEENGYPREFLLQIGHAVIAHSTSGGVTPVTPEAKVVSDADNCDAMGFLGIVRATVVGALTDREFCGAEIPDLETPIPIAPTSSSTIDHLWYRMHKTCNSLMYTKEGKRIARARLKRLYLFLDWLREEKSEIQTFSSLTDESGDTAQARDLERLHLLGAHGMAAEIEAAAREGYPLYQSHLDLAKKSKSPAPTSMVNRIISNSVATFAQMETDLGKSVAAKRLERVDLFLEGLREEINGIS